ncbi:LysE family transporter [Megasphaera paucivorans]|uniref:L-lysine exporter family protein LysE/ArgO n=1 Tax=Megasphaera paucivorans TaxID=349095 RepID=A0A1G9V3E8_9FIRM|nr:LysE family transporter [Megasphaera paucivorans]SDM66659.1 L-lysine exporter family protein LysE/ArgO [Megasphaera paucivorans]
MFYYLQGLTLGLAYLAPIGMQNLFVINTALTQRRTRALLTAIIVIFFDVTLALFCFFGVGALMKIYPWMRLIIMGMGGLLVVYIGIILFRTETFLKNTQNTNISLIKVVFTACIVTWFNPQAIIDGTMMLGAFQATLPETEIVHFLMGMISASGLWFLGITFFVSLCNRRFTPQVLHVINKTCGIVIIGYGVNLLIQFCIFLP